jgi:hypothetical protein
MARLAFFTEVLPGAAGGDHEITDFSYDLMVSLADQQHDVRVFSTYREGESLPPSHPRLQIIRPFRKWSWLEIPRLVPILLEFQPEILHFIQPRKEAFSGLTNATSALPGLASAIGRPRIVVSLYDVRASELQRNRLLLLSADTVVVANKQQADEVEAWFDDQSRASKLPKASIEIVSLPAQTPPDEFEVLPALERLPAKDLIFVPGDLDEQKDRDALAMTLNELLSAIPASGVIFGGGWGRLTLSERRAFMRQFEDRGNGARILLTGPLSAAGELSCLEVSRIVLLAGLPDSSLSLARHIRYALLKQRPLVLNEDQCRLDPIKWRDRENAFIVSNDARTLGPTLSEALLDTESLRAIRSRLPDFARTEAVDEPGNAMSRIYAQALRTPRKPVR